MPLDCSKKNATPVKVKKPAKNRKNDQEKAKIESLMTFNSQAKTCTATRRDGNPCTNPALREEEFCRHHAPSKTRRARHFLRDGTFAARLSTNEEQELFERTLDAIERDFALNQSSDRMQAEMASVYFVKWRDALRKGDGGAMFQFDELIRKNLGALKMTREKRELPAADVGTPAEWAARLLSQSKPKETELPEESKTNGTEDQTEIAVDGER